MKELPQKLIEALRAGKEDGYRQLYELYDESVYALAYSILQNDADAQDAVQRTFIQVFRKLPSLKNDAGFVKWMLKIANNESLMILRKRKNILLTDDGELLSPDPAEEDPMLPTDFVEQRDAAAELRRIIKKLPESQRRTLVLYYFHELKLKEIAELMDCSESTAKSRLRYARTFVRREVEAWEKKHGEKLRGAAAPFGEVFVRLLKKYVPKTSRKSLVWKRIRPAVYLKGDSIMAGMMAAETAFAVRVAAGAAVCLIAVMTGVGFAVGGDGDGGSFYGGTVQDQKVQEQEAMDSGYSSEYGDLTMAEPTEEDYQLIELINSIRSGKGLQPFEISEEMIGYASGFAHDCSLFLRGMGGGPYEELIDDYMSMNYSRWIDSEISGSETLQAVAEEWCSAHEYIQEGKIGVGYDEEEACWGILIDRGYIDSDDPNSLYIQEMENRSNQS